MKGLMIKDWYIVRTQLILSICLFILPNLYLIALAVDYAPTEDYTAGFFPTVMAGIISFLSIVSCTSFMINTVGEDVSCGWTKYALTAPLSRTKLCAAKILNSLILISVLSTASFLVNLFVAQRCGNREIVLAVPICAAFFQLGALSPVFPLAMRFGARKATAFYIMLLLLGIGILAAACILLFKSGHIMWLRWIFYGGIPVSAVISAVGSTAFGRGACREI